MLEVHTRTSVINFKKNHDFRLNSVSVKQNELGTDIRPYHRLCLLIKSLGNCQWLKIEVNSDTNYKWEYTVHNAAISTLCTTYVVVAVVVIAVIVVAVDVPGYQN